MIAAIESQGLGKRFGDQDAVADVDLLVPEGSVYGFLGPNGAGKTTTIRMALGLLHPSSGSIAIHGADVARERMKTAAMIGSMVEVPALYDKLTGRENLELGRVLIGAPKSDVDRVLEVVGLTDAAKRLAGRYSQGMRQRLGLARALLGKPKLLILDEPTNGLDPDGIREIRDLIREAPGLTGATVFVSSHLLAEVEQMATHVGIMHKGRLAAQGSLAELKGKGANLARIGVDDSKKALKLLKGAGFDAWLFEGGLKLALPDGPGDAQVLAAANRALVEAGIAVFALEKAGRSLEDIYLQVTASPKRKKAA